MSKSNTKKTKAAKAAPKKGLGKGHFKATPLTFTGTDGVEHTYGGRGRYSVPLAMLVVANSKVPMKTETGWSWRDATAEELASSKELVANVANRIMAKAEAKVARDAAREQRKAEKAAAKTAAKVVKVSKPKAKKVKKVVDLEAPVTIDVPVTETAETPVAAE